MNRRSNNRTRLLWIAAAVITAATLLVAMLGALRG